ncbi:hypothetical protein CERZMDRAFT_99880 [Cercospora zeae-maydis SCOH1-5]|uniref:FAD/NAD(P)-binding domain-containing protein n=1 Tax=Cercospora zeae-maydis SCOH1-5 TaxID=717836 RepID=A0A6A6F8V2_9PEZI|nr:hypothetical protein CERZMDRAFT_99880 [Cercospora zeae-maydis SCOH1-5]
MAPTMFERDVNLTHEIDAARQTMITTQTTMANGDCVHDQRTHVDDQFIRKAIEISNPNALRLALYQVIGDPELAKMRTRRHAVRGGAMYAHVLDESEIPALHEKAFAYLSQLDSRKAMPPPPSKAEARKMMDIWGDEPIDDADFQFNYEELAYDEFPRTTQWTDKKPSADKINAFKIIVIGGGISGVATAVQFKNLGLNFQVLERQHDIGGTWLLNTYLDARETRAYLAYVVQQHGVRNHFLFNREVTRAVEVVTCNAIVSGSGLFATPNSKPDIPGIDDFKGHIFHTAKWDHSVEYKDKPVALLDSYRNPVDEYSRWTFDNMPYYWNWYCYGAHVTAHQLQYLQDIDPEWQAKTGGINERNDKVKAALTDYIQSKAEGQPGLLEKLLPKHAPLVRRLAVDNGFYDMLREDHVELVTENINRFTKAGIETADGKVREFDVVVLGTGFKAEVWARYTADCIIHLLENDKQAIDVRKDVYKTYNEALDKKAATLL